MAEADLQARLRRLRARMAAEGRRAAIRAIDDAIASARTDINQVRSSE